MHHYAYLCSLESWKSLAEEVEVKRSTSVLRIVGQNLKLGPRDWTLVGQMSDPLLHIYHVYRKRIINTGIFPRPELGDVLSLCQ